MPLPLILGEAAPWFTAPTPSNPQFVFDTAAGRYVLMLFHSLKVAYFVMIFMLDKWGVKMSQFIEYVSERKFDLVACPILVRELNCYDEIAAGTVFLLGKKETEKLRKKLKKRIISL